MRFESFSDALFHFERLENNLDLPNWKINNVYVWKLMRFSAFRHLRMIHGLSKEAHPELNRLKRKKIDHIVTFPIEFFRYNPFFYYMNSVDRVIIASSRKQRLGAEWVDSTTFRAWSGEKVSNSLVLDQVSPIRPVRTRGFPDASVLNRLGWAAGKSFKVRLSPGDKDLIRIIEEKVMFSLQAKKYFSESRVISAVQYFLGLKTVYRALFRLKKPKALYLVCGYGNEAPVAAARELGIITAEFQHGSMGRGHLGYDYLNWDHVPYFADHLLVWGRGWHKQTSLPRECSLIEIGHPHIYFDNNAAEQRESRQEQILLVISQAPVAEALMVTITEFLEKRRDWLVRIRPHPSESLSQWERFLAKKDSAKLSQIEIDKDKSLSTSARLAKVVLGVNSTALVESLLYGCKVAVLRIPQSAPYFQGLLDVEDAVAIQNGTELAECIDHIPKGDPGEYFSSQVQDVCGLVEDAWC